MPVFISYSQKDTAPYTSLCLVLQSEKIEYWDAGRMKVGMPLRDQLREALLNCEVCIFIITRSSIKSPWCLAETGAFWGAGKRIILYVANPDIKEQDLPQLFRGDLRTCDAAEAVLQAKQALAEANTAKQAIAESNFQPELTKNNKEFERDHRFRYLTQAEKSLLRGYVENETRTRHLQYDDGVVTGLIRDHILYYASDRAVSYWDPHKLYTDVNLELWAWQYLIEHPEVLADNSDSSLLHKNEA